ncbi:LLM class flavin-dependent oxidoreductase [Geomicrobium sp. JCM 19055]|uniref:LLM class flavin-dependent oxidoreductase n=1 Tax=Geomicrobium sp. JCM 19055 TaxID=1460649 RepID=UPI00045ECEDD|nr:LLM class flavin-dependent oxidoreductase [Geomicrobium sp. JCM 19055]GAJ99490.1 F420-dependent N5,N10-methylene tetrahydromethanopterin reductase and related flavin-dependent oxidoreductase [Geomicrobium sp. JCM 19055]
MTEQRKRMYLNAFDMNCASHQSPGLWAHPDDQKSVSYKTADYWIELAKTLERGFFDGIFLADVLGTYDVYKGTRDTAIEHGVQAPVNDPSYLVPLMASATKHLGFGLTVSTTHENPYIFARRMSTLDHLTNGRIGWNIVTSYLESASRNIGLKQVKHDERYEIAEEYLEVVYKLWEGSWEDDAVQNDKENRRFADPNKVHDINHYGKHYEVPGAHLCEPSPQRTPVLFQAGASKRGKQFASKHAELVFISVPEDYLAKRYVDELNEELNLAGRDRSEVKVLSLLTPIIGKTKEEAEAKREAYRKFVSHEGSLALIGGWTGIDFSGYEKEDKVEYIENEAMRSSIASFTNQNADEWTVGEFSEFVSIGGRGKVIVGTAEEVADQMQEWMETTGVDGFNIAYSVSPGTFEDFVDNVVPILQERGLVRTSYEEGTYRNNLFGYDQLPEHHVGRTYRQLSAEIKQ